MPIEQTEINSIGFKEIIRPLGNLPFVLLHMERQPIINVQGNYDEQKQVWIDNDPQTKRSLVQRTPTLTGTQTQAGRQLDIDRDQD